MRGMILTAAIFLSLMDVTAMAGPQSATARKPISIPAQQLRSALETLGKNHELQILYRTEVIGSIRTEGVSGELTFDEALKALLKNTGLTSKYVDEKTVTIVRETVISKSGHADPADQMRVAQDTAAGNAPARAAGNSGDGQQVTVEGQRENGKPFTDGNLDLPRTIDDVQPYYIFDAKTVEASGAVNIEDFLKRRLTMNTVGLTNAQDPTSSLGNISTINLRGVGTDKTLILVNGRRMPGVNTGLTEYQADLNGIPLSRIDRIEVLPSSASGIYGGSAIGGVVNVILKRDYAGGEVRLNYENTSDGDSPRRNVSMSHGFSLEEGRTSLNVSASWSEQEPLLLRDRVDIYRDNLLALQSRVPTFIFASTNPWLGSLPNIQPGSSPRC